MVICSLFSIAAICGFFFWNEYRTAREEIAEYTELQSNYTSELTGSADTVGSSASDVAMPETARLPYIAADFDSLLAINPETVGWLAIPGTEVCYPVLQAGDNTKYLNTSFYGEKSSTGAVFLDHGNAADPLDANSILYGHNMGAGRKDMFGALLEYKEASYYGAHQWIQFDTVYRQYGWWRVFAVVSLDIKTTGFDYLKQNFADAAEHEAWIAQAQALSLYSTGVEVQPLDRTLVLSTCDRSVSKNGRLLVMAVQVGGDGL